MDCCRRRHKCWKKFYVFSWWIMIYCLKWKWVCFHYVLECPLVYMLFQGKSNEWILACLLNTDTFKPIESCYRKQTFCTVRLADFVASLMLSSMTSPFYKQCLYLCNHKVSTIFYGIGDDCKYLAVLTYRWLEETAVNPCYKCAIHICLNKLIIWVVLRECVFGSTSFWQQG